MSEPGVPPTETHRSRERRGVWVSALISAGLFTAPWIMALAVGVYAEFEPATDIVIDLYEPIETVYLTLDPPPSEEPNFPEPPDLEVDAPDGVEEEVPPEDAGVEEGDDEGTDTVDEEAAEGAGEGEGGDDGPADAEAPVDDGAEPVARKVGGGDDAEGEGGDGDGPRSRYARKGTRSSCKEPHPNVREGTDGVMEVDRSLVEYYTASLSRFMELGYSEPFNKDGTKGFYIGGFGCKSPVYKAGLRRGDVLLRVNGQKTRTWVGVFFLYKKLKNKDVFEVELIRKGSDTPQTLTFRVVDA